MSEMEAHSVLMAMNCAIYLLGNYFQNMLHGAQMRQGRGKIKSK